eukprot:424913-Prorocentrum_minimum.AAC.3
MRAARKGAALFIVLGTFVVFAKADPQRTRRNLLNAEGAEVDPDDDFLDTRLAGGTGTPSADSQPAYSRPNPSTVLPKLAVANSKGARSSNPNFANPPHAVRPLSMSTNPASSDTHTATTNPTNLPPGAKVVTAKVPSHIQKIAPPSKGGVFEAATRIEALPKDISTCTRDGSPAVKQIFSSRVWFAAAKEGFNPGDKVFYFETNCRFEKANTWDGGTWWTIDDTLFLLWDNAEMFRNEALKLEPGNTFLGATLTLTNPQHIPEPEDNNQPPLNYLFYFWGKPDSNPLWLCFRNWPHNYINSCNPDTPLMTFTHDWDDLAKADLIGIDISSVVAHTEMGREWKFPPKKPHQHYVGMSRELGHVLIGKEKMEALLKQYSVVMDWRMDGSVPMSFHHYHFFGTHNADDYYQ